jgi:tRNA A37 threonylcarbamoyltransferase TsaD
MCAAHRNGRLDESEIDDICASFSVSSSYACSIACSMPPIGLGESVGIAGACRANAACGRSSQIAGVGRHSAYVPHISLSTDNAAMIAAAGCEISRAATSGVDLNCGPLRSSSS